MKIGIVGAGSIGLASAVWTASRGYTPILWSPRENGDVPVKAVRIESSGILESNVSVRIAQNAQMLAACAQVILIAIPANGHKAVIDALLPYLRSGHIVIISSMASLSSLYLYEAAIARNVSMTVASFGTTALTARRQDKHHVRIMTRRTSLGVSCLPISQRQKVLTLCESLFGHGFTPDENMLSTTLTNTNPVAHAPLALLNWTRIELGEHWPQYQFMTPRVSAVIEQLDAERRVVAQAFGLTIRTIEQHFRHSFNTESDTLADIAAELHAKRGGPPGPTDMKTRFLSEDVPYGLVFTARLGKISQVPISATDAIVTLAGLVTRDDFSVKNDLIDVLRLPDESVAGLLARVNIQ